MEEEAEDGVTLVEEVEEDTVEEEVAEEATVNHPTVEDREEEEVTEEEVVSLIVLSRRWLQFTDVYSRII